MFIEQIRYYIDEENRDQIVEARREVDRIRSELGLPVGHILLADPPPDGGPSVVWQCGYADEGAMGAAEAALIGNSQYEAARGRLAEFVTRVELELYMADEPDQE